MNMKKIGLLCLLGAGFGCPGKCGKNAFGFNSGNGECWIELAIKEMNVYTRGNTDAFINDVVISFGAPRPLVSEYVLERRWAPGDVYYACALAQQAHVPCINTLREYDKNNGQGWGVIARRMGIKPGSPEFQALKGRVGNSNGKFKARGKYKTNQGEGMYRYGADKPGNSGHDNGKKNGKGKDKKGY